MKTVSASAASIAALSAIVATVALAEPVAQRASRVVPAVVTTTTVGPAGVPAEHPVLSPAPRAGASQLVTAVTQSTSTVRLTGVGEPVYLGTEPATMTLIRRGASEVVTVVPR